jgi:hypothetical protein
MARSKAPVTAATRELRAHNVDFSDHPYVYEEHGGTAVSARELGVPEHAVIKTLIMEDEAGRPLIVSGPANAYLIVALPPKRGQARREERSLVIPNKRRATRHGPFLGAARRAGAASVQSDLPRYGVAPRSYGMTTSRSLRLVSRQSGHWRVDLICINRPLCTAI